jgi:alkanesulfonate monooxygenase SsuD/methylene tetrahydromethanopterin reductase-like flavin-dependent oxidoreductase (luciferase family)
MVASGQRRFRFGVRNTGTSLEEWQHVARKAEDLGFSTLVVQDHVGQQLAPLPAHELSRQKLGQTGQEAWLVASANAGRDAPAELVRRPDTVSLMPRT